MKIYNVLRIVFLIQFGFFIMLLGFSGCKGGDGNVKDVAVDTEVSETAETEEVVEKIEDEVVEGEKEVEVGASDAEEHVEEDDGGVSEGRPEDMPSVAGASDFTWVGAAGSGMLSFKINGNKFDKVCESQSKLILEKDWILKEDIDGQFEGTATKKYEKEGFTLSLTCTEQVSDEKSVTVTMVKGAR